MNDTLVRKFCESPHRKLITAIVTTLFGLLVLIPLVDDYLANRDNLSTLIDDLGRAQSTAEGLPRLEKEVGKVIAKLAEAESRSVSGDSLGMYRNKVVGLVNAAVCQVQQFNVGAPVVLPWMKGDSLLEQKVVKSAKTGKTPFVLERRNVVLLVDGSMANLKELLKDMYEDDTMAYTHYVELKAASRNREEVTLQIEVWLFTLNREKV